jgi:hypothetical protein
MNDSELKLVIHIIPPSLGMCVPAQTGFLSYVTDCRANVASLSRDRMFWFAVQPYQQKKSMEENNVVRNLYRRLHYPNHRLGYRSQHAPPASEVDRCGSCLSGGRGHYPWRQGHSTKGSFVLSLFLTPRFPPAALKRSAGLKFSVQPQCSLRLHREK